MKRSFSMALVVASMLTFSCSAEQIAQVNAIAIQSKSGPAVRLATSAAIAQMALFHLAAAVSQAASNDFDDPNAAPMAPSAGPDSEFTYEVDREAGTGRIIRSHAGKRAVDLEFTFEGEGSNGGMAYAITSTNGHFEGYQLFFPRLTLLYTAILSDAFNPLKHENGNLLINVTISASPIGNQRSCGGQDCRSGGLVTVSGRRRDPVVGGMGRGDRLKAPPGAGRGSCSRGGAGPRC